MRDGMNLAGGGTTTINSLYQLIGASAKATANGKSTTFQSPWVTDPGKMKSYLPDMFDKLTTVDGPYIEGRININLAGREILQGIPNMTESLLQTILAAQMTSSTGESLSSQSADHATTGWLVFQNLMTLSQLAQFDPFLTARGDMFHAQVVGYFDSGGPVTRIEAVIDSTHFPPQPVFLRDLTDLGRGYSPSLLGITK